ncbi:unnamed protein product [Sphagnum jensenii]|uniref:Uncharacterized protein n=1 Tax=Sphagnum jensenii TaxID=128206 RepID=A0ABP0VKB2_9BRYO
MRKVMVCYLLSGTQKVKFTEDWFVYDDAIAMWTSLEEAILTGPTFENGIVFGSYYTFYDDVWVVLH